MVRVVISHPAIKKLVKPALHTCDVTLSGSVPWQTNDVIFYWVYVIVDGLEYQRLSQRHTIRAVNAGPAPRGPFQVPSPMFHLTPHVITVTVPGERGGDVTGWGGRGGGGGVM